MNHINLVGDKLTVSVKYDPQITAVIKSIQGRVWNPAMKRWEIPSENAIEAVDKLLKLGFTPTLDVLRVVDAQKEELWRAEDIKRTIPHYSGILPLYDFQKVGWNFLKNMPHALLADVPGLGKTIQTIAAIGEFEKILVLCPASLKYSWSAEIKKWDDKANPIVINGTKGECKRLWLTEGKYHIANYERLLADHPFMPKEWDVIIADEATRISNPRAKTTLILKSLKAKKRIALTGTPISNSPEDIYSIIDWIAPGYLGTYNQFIEKYAVKVLTPFPRIVGYRNLADLAQRIERFVLRRTKEEVLKDFPPKTVEDVVFDLSESERKLYEGVRMQIVEELEKLTVSQRTLGIIPVKMLRLKQVADHSGLITQDPKTSSKVQALLDLIEPIHRSGEKTIVFTQFAQMAKLLLSHLNAYNPRIIMGEMDAPSRQKAVEEFNSDPSVSVIIMTEAGAYGLNLQSASYVVHFDAPWSIAKLMQREDRAHRIGQTKPVTVYNLIARDTIDEYVTKVLHKKQKMSVGLLQDADRLEEMGLEEEDVRKILRI